jgi:hypothetical protein
VRIRFENIRYLWNKQNCCLYYSSPTHISSNYQLKKKSSIANVLLYPLCLIQMPQDSLPLCQITATSVTLNQCCTAQILRYGQPLSVSCRNTLQLCYMNPLFTFQGHTDNSLYNMISGFCRCVNEIFTLLGDYAVYTDSHLPLCWDNLSVSWSRVKQSSKTSCHYTYHNPDKLSPYPHIIPLDPP